MSRTARLCQGAGFLTLGGLVLTGAVALAGDPSADQFVNLGQQAKNIGRSAEAARFFQQALKRDPKNAEAKKGLEALKTVRLNRQDPPAPPPPPPAGEAPAPPAGDAPPAPMPAGDTPPPAPAGDPAATIERASQNERILAQQITADVNDRIDRARDLLNRGAYDEARELLRNGITAVRGETNVSDVTRNALLSRLGAQIQANDRRADELELRQAESRQRQNQSEARMRVLEAMAINQENTSALMTRFDTLMNQGQYNVLFTGGTGDISKAIAPFAEARLYAVQARAKDQNATAPRAGIEIAMFEGSLATELMNEELKEYRFLLTLNDVTRASVPFPDTLTIEYPEAEHWREISEKRIKRYESVSLDSRDSKTQAIITALDKPISMPFAAETPLQEVIKYIKTATADPMMPQGIPIYIDPVGLNEAEKTMDSPITLNLDGVSLKRSLKLLLKQLDLTYTVKEGLMTITYYKSGDQQTEIRVYPVADLAIIPISLLTGGGGGGMGGGGMGGMGGGMGGGGMGGGGMGGGMGGGGMGGMGGGGMRSMPLAAPQDPGSPFAEKKSN